MLQLHRSISQKFWHYSCFWRLLIKLKNGLDDKIHIAGETELPKRLYHVIKVYIHLYYLHCNYVKFITAIG